VKHRELGREMKQTAARLRTLCDLMIDVYGPQSRTAFSFLKALEALENLGMDMQAQASQDLPGHDGKDLYL